jgi:hypothetical protein
MTEEGVWSMSDATDKHLHVVYGSPHEVAPVYLNDIAKTVLVDLSFKQFHVPPGSVLKLYVS